MTWQTRNIYNLPAIIVPYKLSNGTIIDLNIILSTSRRLKKKLNMNFICLECRSLYKHDHIHNCTI